MKFFYSLRIVKNDLKSDIESIDRILFVTPTKKNDTFWELEIVESKEDKPIDFINYFLDLLENKYSELLKIGIKREDISIWELYEYDGQCNIEFLPDLLQRIGENGISLCISCWESREGEA